MMIIASMNTVARVDIANIGSMVVVVDWEGGRERERERERER